MAQALQQWEIENATKIVDPVRDALYIYDDKSQKAQNDAKPWRQDENFFKSIRISAVALLKMVMHARSGGTIEVMGLMQGHISGNEFIVTDAFRLPVEGTETRVNAQESANEFMVEFLSRARESGQVENAIGWYHSHPGYGCWLSGIDVSTQHTQQMFQDPFVAVVIDPDRTVSAGKVEIGAFRTYSEEYSKNKSGSTDLEGFQTIPLAKAEDFGAYADRYYSLEVSHFKSTLDADLLESLWNKYWVGTLTASPLYTNRDYGTKQIADLAEKVRRTEQSKRSHMRGGQGGRMFSMRRSSQQNGGHDEQMETIVKVGNKITAEEQAGLLASDIKERLFGGVQATK